MITKWNPIRFTDGHLPSRFPTQKNALKMERDYTTPSYSADYSDFTKTILEGDYGELSWEE